MSFGLFAVGTVAVSAGAWMAWPPLGPIVFGGILMFVALRLTAIKPE